MEKIQYNVDPGGPRTMLRVLLILGHPRHDSLCAALAEAYVIAARATGAEVRQLSLNQLAFDPYVHFAHFDEQEAEPDIVRAREWIAWAEHIVIVHPLWWGGIPAILKGFLDRVLAPGFAFVTQPGGTGYRGLLCNRSARLVVTMDTPPTVYRWLLRQPGITTMRRDVLGFCGIAPVEVMLLGPVRSASPGRIKTWIAAVQAAGFALPRTVGRWTAILHSAWAWLVALRLQFYPMTWLAYTLGALHATSGRHFSWSAYLIGYSGIFLLEVATVLLNERMDVKGDRANLFYGPFNGGSRVLVDGRILKGSIDVVIAITALISIACLMVAAHQSGQPLLLDLSLLGFVGLCLGYTGPPLRLSYRGLGEITVSVTHGVLVVMLGHLFQGGSWLDSKPWLLALPISAAILPSIILANVPDRKSDAEVGKRTVAVLLGNRWASRLAGAAAIIAVTLALGCSLQTGTAGLLLPIVPFAGLHALLLCLVIRRYINQGAPDGRLDGLIVTALTFMLWFIAIPLIILLVS